MQLCLAMGCTLGELGRRMSAEEFGLWVALYHKNPWGSYRDNVHAALISKTVMKMAGKALKGDPPPLSDFMIFDGEDDEGGDEAKTDAVDPVVFFKGLQ